MEFMVMDLITKWFAFQIRNDKKKENNLRFTSPYAPYYLRFDGVIFVTSCILYMPFQRVTFAFNKNLPTQENEQKVTKLMLLIFYQVITYSTNALPFICEFENSHCLIILDLLWIHSLSKKWVMIDASLNVILLQVFVFS